MFKYVFILGLAIILAGCGEEKPPEDCSIEMLTYYTYNTAMAGWQGPWTKPLCVVR